MSDQILKGQGWDGCVKDAFPQRYRIDADGRAYVPMRFDYSAITPPVDPERIDNQYCGCPACRSTVGCASYEFVAGIPYRFTREIRVF